MKLSSFLLLFLLISPAPARPSLLSKLRSQAQAQKLNSRQSYLKSVQASHTIFTQQGAIVTLDSQLPCLILPDLHAQRDYLLRALELPWKGQTVYQALEQGKLTVLCLGDGMHAEQRAQSRWEEAESDFLAGRASAALKEEMVESLGLMQMVMDLKVAFPKHFYFLRGNHEDMDPTTPYFKFTRVGESNLVRNWVEKQFGADFLEAWHECEKSMPLVAQGASFVASHAAPEFPITQQDVEKRSNRAFRACCWSDNTTWRAGGAQEKAFLANCQTFGVSPERPWVVGHRKVVDGLYRLQCEGRLLQINPLDSNPKVILWAPPKGKLLKPQQHVKKL